MKPLICVFAKVPAPGEVKTRLSRRFGDDGAARLARAFLQDTLALVRRVRWAKPVLALSGGGFSARGVEVWDQGEGDLGQRLQRVLSRALSHAPFAIALGADSPGLPPSRLDDARFALEANRAVLGPADDGGFYLLGLTRCPRGLFEGLRFSHTRAMDETAARLTARKMPPALLAPWFDVDRPADVTRLRRLLALGEVRAPATARALAALY